MDLGTAFSLACGVIQVLGFSIEILEKCKEIYEPGLVSEYRDLEEVTRHLSKLDNDVGHAEGGQVVSTSPLSDDDGLLDLAKGCSATAKQLLEQLTTLKIEGAPRKRQALFNVLKGVWWKKEVKAIQKRLDGYRIALDT